MICMTKAHLSGSVQAEEALATGLLSESVISTMFGRTTVWFVSSEMTWVGSLREFAAIGSVDGGRSLEIDLLAGLEG